MAGRGHLTLMLDPSNDVWEICSLAKKLRAYLSAKKQVMFH